MSSSIATKPVSSVWAVPDWRGVDAVVDAGIGRCLLLGGSLDHAPNPILTFSDTESIDSIKPAAY